MDKTREARRSSTTLAASNGVTKRRQRISENSRGQMHQEVVTVRDRPERKERVPESLNRSKRRRSERFAPRSVRDVEEDSSDESLEDADVKHNYHRKSFPSGRTPRHAASLKVADGMIGVPVPRKARSACMKRSHDCRTSSGSGGGGFGEDRRRHPTSNSPGSYSFEVVSPSSSTVSVKQKKDVNGSKNRIPKPPKSSGTIEDDLEIEIAEVLYGLKKQHHSSKREDDDDSENSLKSSEVKGANKLKTEGDDSSAGVGLITCKPGIIETGFSGKIDKSTNGTKTSSPSILDGVLEKQRLDSLDSAVSKGASEGPQLENNRDESNCSSKLEIDLMVPPATPSSPKRLSLLPLVSDSIVTKDYCKHDISVKSKEKIIVQKCEWLNLDLERPSQETGRDSSLTLQNLDWSQPQQAQQNSVLPLGWPSGLPPQGYVPLIQNGKPVDGSSGSSTLVQGGPFSASQLRPKRCATHFFIARNIQLHQHFVKTNHLSQPNKDSVYLKGGNPSLVGSSPNLSLNFQTQDRIAVDVSAPKDKAYESGHFASTRQKKPQLPPTSSRIVPAQAFIFPSDHHLQPVIVPSKLPRPAVNPCVAAGSASVNFNHPSSLACEASSPFFSVLPNNGDSFQLSSTIRGGTPSQGLPFFNGSFYSPQMFQPPQLLQKQSQAPRETKAGSCTSSSHRQPQQQPQVSGNSLPSQANVQKHRQQTQKSEAKAAGDNSDSRSSHTQKGGPYGQIMTAPMQPQNFSMSFASFAGGSAPANLNFSSNGYHIVSAPAVVHRKNHQASDSKTGGGSNAEDQKKALTGKPTTMTNGQTLVFDNPSRTLNFVSGTWPPPAATTINGDPSVFTHHLTQRQQQSGRSKTMTTHSQADAIPAAKSSQWKIPATPSLTSCNSLNLKQLQSQQHIRTHGQTQISFAAPSKSQPSQGHQGRPGGSYSSVTGSAPHGNAANLKVNNSKAPSSAAHPQDQTENSALGSTQKTSPVCGRNVPRIITSCPDHMSELKY